jgi:hypothetical protein
LSGQIELSHLSHISRQFILSSGNLPEERIRVVLDMKSGGIAGKTSSASVGK